jgi:hypothetical protein
MHKKVKISTFLPKSPLTRHFSSLVEQIGPAAESRWRSGFLAGHAAPLAGHGCNLGGWRCPKMTCLWPRNRAINFTLTLRDDGENRYAFNDLAGSLRIGVERLGAPQPRRQGCK